MWCLVEEVCACVYGFELARLTMIGMLDVLVGADGSTGLDGGVMKRPDEVSGIDRESERDCAIAYLLAALSMSGSCARLSVCSGGLTLFIVKNSSSLRAVRLNALLDWE